MCTIANETASVNHYYNPSKNSDQLMPQLIGSYGLSNVNISLEDNTLTCSFTRENMVKNVTNYFSTNQPYEYYLLTAKGIIKDNSKLNFSRFFSDSNVKK
jgi:hypothetical protein